MTNQRRKIISHLWENLNIKNEERISLLRFKNRFFGKFHPKVISGEISAGQIENEILQNIDFHGQIYGNSENFTIWKQFQDFMFYWSSVEENENQFLGLIVDCFRLSEFFGVYSEAVPDHEPHHPLGRSTMRDENSNYDKRYEKRNRKSDFNIGWGHGNGNGKVKQNNYGSRRSNMNGSIRDRSVRDRSIHDRNIRDRSVYERNERDRSLYERNERDRSRQDRSIRDKSRQDINDRNRQDRSQNNIYNSIPQKEEIKIDKNQNFYDKQNLNIYEENMNKSRRSNIDRNFNIISGKQDLRNSTPVRNKSRNNDIRNNFYDKMGNTENSKRDIYQKRNNNITKSRNRSRNNLSQSTFTVT